MKVMQEHLVYWKELAERKIVVVFGPVADPKETYRLAIVEAEDVAIAHEYGILFPAIKADMGFKFDLLIQCLKLFYESKTINVKDILCPYF